MSIAVGRRSPWPGASTAGLRPALLPVAAATATGLAGVGVTAIAVLRRGSNPVLAVTSHLPQPMTHVSRTVGMVALALALGVTLPALVLVRRRAGGAAARLSPRAALTAPGVRTALAALVLVEVLDAVTTVAGLLSGLHEGNQLYAMALPHAGLLGLAAMKLPVIALAVGIASVLPRRAAVAALWAAAAVTGFAVAQNLGLLLAGAGH